MKARLKGVLFIATRSIKKDCNSRFFLLLIFLMPQWNHNGFVHDYLLLDNKPLWSLSNIRLALKSKTRSFAKAAGCTKISNKYYGPWAEYCATCILYSTSANVKQHFREFIVATAVEGDVQLQSHQQELELPDFDDILGEIFQSDITSYASPDRPEHNHEFETSNIYNEDSYGIADSLNVDTHQDTYHEPIGYNRQPNRDLPQNMLPDDENHTSSSDSNYVRRLGRRASKRDRNKIVTFPLFSQPLLDDADYYFKYLFPVLLNNIGARKTTDSIVIEYLTSWSGQLLLSKVLHALKKLPEAKSNHFLREEVKAELEDMTAPKIQGWMYLEAKDAPVISNNSASQFMSVLKKRQYERCQQGPHAKFIKTMNSPFIGNSSLIKYSSGMRDYVKSLGFKHKLTTKGITLESFHPLANLWAEVATQHLISSECHYEFLR